MQKNLISTLDEAASTTPVTLNAVIFYDDVDELQTAMRVLDQTAGLAHSVEARPQLWRFDLLHNPDCWKTAIIDAVGAGVIMVASSDGGDCRSR